jgi:hypothetical protein
MDLDQGRDLRQAVNSRALAGSLGATDQHASDAGIYQVQDQGQAQFVLADDRHKRETKLCHILLLAEYRLLQISSICHYFSSVQFLSTPNSALFPLVLIYR